MGPALGVAAVVVAVVAAVGVDDRAGEPGGGTVGLDEVGGLLDVVDQCGDRRLDPLEDRLGVDAEEHDEGEQRSHHGELPEAHLVGLVEVGLGGLAVEHPLVGPQQVEGGEDHAGGGGHGPPLRGEVGAGEDHELAHEAVEAGQADRGQHHQGEHAGQEGRSLLHARHGADLVGVAALVDHPEQEEQGTGRDAVVDHLEHTALDALAGEGEGAQGDEAEVGDRGVGDEPLDVLLHRGHHGAVEDADDAEGDEHGGEEVRRVGEQVEPEAHEAVRAQLEHHAGQDHRAGGGGLGVGVGQPGVQREQRHLDREREREGEEDPPRRLPVGRVPRVTCVERGLVDLAGVHGGLGLGQGLGTVLGDGDEVEGQLVGVADDLLELGEAVEVGLGDLGAGAEADVDVLLQEGELVALGLGPLELGVLVEEGQRQDADQHQGRAEHRVQEELQRRVDALAVAPPADEEVHRHEHDLEEDEEQEQVEGAEGADAPGLQEQQPGVVRLGVLLGGDRHEGEREQHARQHDQEQRDAVHAEVPLDAELLDPDVHRLELEAGLAGVERAEHPQREGAGGRGEQQRHGAEQLGPACGQDREEQRPGQGHEDRRRQQREGEVGGEQHQSVTWARK